MRKTLVLTAFILVLSACTSTGGDTRTALAEPTPATSETPDTTEAPATGQSEEPATDPEPVSSSTIAPTSTSTTEAPSSPSDGAEPTPESTPATDVATVLASAVNYTATVTGATLNGNALTIVNGNQVNVPAGESGTITVTVTIDYSTWKGADCTTQKTYCQWQISLPPSSVSPIPPGGNLGTGYTRQTVNTQGQTFTVSTASGDDDTPYSLTYGYSSKGGAPPRTGQQSFTILIHRLSEA